MKRSKYCKYQAPRLTPTALETEGICAQSVLFNAEVEELDHINNQVPSADQGTANDPFYLDF